MYKRQVLLEDVATMKKVTVVKNAATLGDLVTSFCHGSFHHLPIVVADERAAAPSFLGGMPQPSRLAGLLSITDVIVALQGAAAVPESKGFWLRDLFMPPPPKKAAQQGSY